MLAEFDFTILPKVNASLNALATVFIVSGLIAIKMRREKAHKLLMMAAAVVSALFLVSYLTYHFNAEPVKFRGEGAIRYVYYTILISHIILAVVQMPLILRTIWLGVRDVRDKHRRLARITAPIWLYVSITGVLVYYFLYEYTPG